MRYLIALFIFIPNAYCHDLLPPDWVGININAGGVHSDELGNGAIIEGHVFLAMFNCAAQVGSFRRHESYVADARGYVGLGFINILQGEVGFGVRGSSFKIRSDIALDLFNKDGNNTPFFPRNSGGHALIISPAYERFDSDNRFYLTLGFSL